MNHNYYVLSLLSFKKLLCFHDLQCFAAPESWRVKLTNHAKLRTSERHDASKLVSPVSGARSRFDHPGELLA